MLNAVWLISAALVGGPVDPPMEQVRQLYEHATYNVDVKPAEARQMVREIEQSLGTPSGDAKKALEALKAEVNKADPNARAIRDLARELYSALEPKPTLREKG